MTEAHNIDCMEAMAQMKDNEYDLAIVDPPYGINIAKWDTKIPSDLYFEVLYSISKNQIIWGGNYFKLPSTEGWICWDKTFKYNQGLEVGEFELAWTSVVKKATFLRYTSCGNFQGFNKPKADYSKKKSFHPTSKPIDIYKWLLKNYAKDGDRILDTHLGSGSSRIAAHDMGFDFVGYEIDKDYFDAQELRFNNHIKQGSLFDAKDMY